MGPEPENSNIAKNYKFMQKFTDFGENLQFFAKICRSLRKFPDFCKNLQISAKIRKLARRLDRRILGFPRFREEHVMLSFLNFCEIRKSARKFYVQHLADLAKS